MKIIVDERETELYDKCYSIVNLEGNSTYIQLSKQVLPLGDVIIKTDEDKEIMLIERKTFADLLASIKDGRYEEQSYRLMHYDSQMPSHSIVYLLEGLFSQLKNPTEKKTLYSAMASLYFFKGFSTFKTSNVRESAEWIIWTANKIERDMLKGKMPYYLNKKNIISKETDEAVTDNSSIMPVSTETNTESMPSVTEVKSSDYCSVVKKVKKENVTPENIGEIMLCQIPGISSVTAIAVMKKYRTITNLIEELKTDSNALSQVVCEVAGGKTRKINKTSVESIKKYLCQVYEEIPQQDT